MKKKLLIAATVAGAAGAYLAAICPRIKDKPDMSSFNGKVFAHRGMHGGKVVENTIEAFEKAVENGYGIELDVQLSADGRAVVFHDYTLFRMFGETKSVCDLTAEELGEYGIPTLEEALAVIDGKVPLIVELKGESADVSVAPIAAEILDEYHGEYCVESFNPLILKWYKDCRPDVIRGQLSTAFMETENKSPKHFAIEHLLTNFVAKPDFIAYEHKYPAKLSVVLCRKVFGIPVIAWTVKTADEWSKCADRFDSYICEGLPKKRKVSK
jgi:glycerophosphoryl diester phosphodiesterase